MGPHLITWGPLALEGCVHMWEKKGALGGEGKKRDRGTSGGGCGTGIARYMSFPTCYLWAANRLYVGCRLATLRQPSGYFWAANRLVLGCQSAIFGQSSG
jgi:hypothetical protein